jgi:hypothetical protein
VVECQLPKLDVGGSNPLARFFSTFVNTHYTRKTKAGPNYVGDPALKKG